MNIGAHWGLWALAIVALVVGLFLVIRSFRNKKWNWAAAGILALILAVGMFARGWTVWPKQTAQRFISCVQQEQYEMAREMLLKPEQLKVSNDGMLSLIADDGTKTTVAADELPLVSGGRKVPISTRSFSAALTAKKNFTVAPSKRSKSIIHCTAERGGVRIRFVEVQNTEVPADSFRLTVEDTPEGDRSTVTKRFVIEVGSPEGKRLNFGTGDSPEKPLTFHEDAPQEPVTFIITGKLLGNEGAETQKLVIDMEQIKARSTSRSSGAIADQIEKGKTISDALSFQMKSGLYKQGVPLDLAKVNVRTAWPRIILYITDTVDDPKRASKK